MQLLISSRGSKQFRSFLTGPFGCHTGLYYSSLEGDVSSRLYPLPNMFIYYSTSVSSSVQSLVEEAGLKECFSASLAIFKFFFKDMYRTEATPWLLEAEMMSDPLWL